MAKEKAEAGGGEWVVKASVADVVAAFCERLGQRLAAAKAGPLATALTGGESVRAFYQGWAAKYSGPRAWDRGAVAFYWSDERVVPPESPDSNYRLAREALLAPAQIPAALIHRIPTEATDPAREYAAELRREIPAGPEGTPHFPILILGLGEDGHTGSLFPHTDILAKNDELVRAAAGTAAHPHPRVTFTPRLMNAAAEVWFLITGAGKAQATAWLYERRRSAEEVPSLIVDPARTRVTYFVDGAAGAKLPVALKVS